MAGAFDFSPMQNATSVNFFQKDPETAIDVNALQRQRQMAQLLTQRGLQGQDGQMVSGHYVPPSALSYINQLASAVLGAQQNRSADAKEAQLAQALLAKRTQDSSDFMSALNGTPASSREVAGPPVEGGSAPMQTTPAVPGDTNKALAIALESQNPQLSGMAPELLKRQMDAAEFNQALAAARGGPAGGATDGAAPGGAPGAAPAGPNAGTFNLNPAAFAFAASPNARAQNLAKMIQEANKPQVLAEGGTLLGADNKPLYIAPKTEAGIQLNNGVASPVPGYGAAKAGMEGQIATAKDDNVLTTRDVGGVPTTKTNAEWRAYYSGGASAPAPAPRAPTQQQAPVRGNFTGTPEQILDQINNSPVSQAVKDEMRRAYTNQVSGNNPDFNPLGTGALPAPTGPVQGQSQADAKYQATRAEDFAKRAGAIQTAGSTASGTMRNLDTLEQLFKDPDVAKGGAAENISALKNLAASTGVDVKGAGAEQGIQAITNKMALDSRSTAEGGGMPGAMSDADRNFLANQQPGLNKTPEGRAIIIDNARKLAQRQIDVARMAQRYEQEHGKIDAGFDRQLQEYADKNQMFSGKKAAAPQAMDIRSLAAQELQRRRGK
jgi:hypothetical protein